METRIRMETMVKAVIFDMGGVIVDLDMDLCVRNFKQKAGFADIEDYLDIYHQKGFISDFEEGTLDEEGFFDECLRHCPEGTTRADIEHSFQSLLTGANKDVVKQIRELSKTCELYVLSNNNPVCTRRFMDILDEEGIRDLFKGMYFSFRMKMLKPGREIYEAVIADIGHSPEEMLFVDDSASNIKGAETVGLRTLLYTRGADIIRSICSPAG